MAKKETLTAPPFSLRLTFAERATLERAAGTKPLGRYIRERLLGDEAAPRKARGGKAVEDQAALARVLGALGSSRLSNNLNQLAHAVNVGALPVTPDTQAELRAACEAVRQIRADLIRALGLPPEVKP